MLVILTAQAAALNAYGCHRSTYNAYRGDTLASIAARYGVRRPATLARMNGLPVDDAVMVGQTLQVPDCRQRR